MAITPLPALDRTDATFKADVDEFFATELPTFSVEVEAARVAIVASEAATAASATAAAGSATTATTQAGIATTQAGISTTQATAAAASAASAANAPGTSATSTTSLTVGTGTQSLTIQTGKLFTVGQTVVIARTSAPTTTQMRGTIDSHNSGTGALVVIVAAGGTTGSGTHTDWTISLSGAQGATGANGVAALPKSPRTSNTILAAGDLGYLIDSTANTYSQTLTAAATLGPGWFCYIGNSSAAGFVTYDPNGAETITVNGNALSTWTLWPREMGLLICNGMGFEYYNIQKGEITQTIASPVAAVDFATGMTYRRRTSLHISNLSLSATTSLLMILNGTNPSIKQRTFSFNGASTITPSASLNSQLNGANLIVANATGSNRFNALISIAINSLCVSAHFSSLHHDSGYNPSTEGYFYWDSYNESNLSSIQIKPNSGTIDTGTFTLKEL